MNHAACSMNHETPGMNHASSMFHRAAEVHRRVEQSLSNFPARLGWMIFQEPDVACECRRTTAHYLLHCHDLDDAFSKKLLDLYRDDFKLCSQIGTLPTYVYRLLPDFFAMVPLDSREVEGANSIIKRIHRLAPNIKLRLMGDRVLIKKMLGRSSLCRTGFRCTC